MQHIKVCVSSVVRLRCHFKPGVYCEQGLRELSPCGRLDWGGVDESGPEGGDGEIDFHP